MLVIIVRSNPLRPKRNRHPPVRTRFRFLCVCELVGGPLLLHPAAAAAAVQGAVVGSEGGCTAAAAATHIHVVVLGTK